VSNVRRIRLALLLVLVVVAAGTVGYVVLGFGVLDAVYQTVTTITTLRRHIERRRMERNIARMTGHTIVCGWGRVGRAVASYLSGQGAEVVVVDHDPERVADIPYARIVGDVTDDDVLRTAGVMRAKALVTAINTDAENVYVTLSARAMRPDLVIIARARTEDSEPKLLRAGATRVVNPQRIGGQRIAAAAAQPNVVEFLDVVMHDGSLEFRLEEVSIGGGSRLAGQTLREADVGATTGALVLALRGADGSFLANPAVDTPIEAGSVLIAIGTEPQLSALRRAAETAGQHGG